MIADVELEYKAEQKLTYHHFESELFDSSNFQETCFNSQINKNDEKSLYFAFINAEGLQSLRMYMDMVIPPNKIPYAIPNSNDKINLTWEYWTDESWKELPSDAVNKEETCGFTQSGFIEIKLPKKISEKNIDSDGKIWLRAIVNGDIKHCLAVRGIWTNVVKIIAQNGDGTSLAADSIKEMQDPDDQIVDITQPFSGFGGKKAVTDILQSSHLRARFNNRHRAINTIDYEQIVIEHFPEVEKAV